MKNKGFSLIELVIVIAIMAILVGVIAPQLIIYVNKTKVSADIQLCDSVQEALVINMVDCAAIDNLDSTSKSQIESLQSGNVVVLKNWDDSSTFAQEVYETLGVNCFASGFNTMLQSSVARQNGNVCAQTYNGELVVWVDKSNALGKNNVIACANASQIDEKVISSQ